MHYVYSTATCGSTYVEYEENASNELAIPKKWPNGKPMKVAINGGSGLADKHLFTPRGVITHVSDEEMEMLLRNSAFKRHIERGFITYDKKKIAPEKKAANMADKDGSAPITPSDYIESEMSTPNQKIYKMKERKTG